MPHCFSPPSRCLLHSPLCRLKAKYGDAVIKKALPRGPIGPTVNPNDIPIGQNPNLVPVGDPNQVPIGVRVRQGEGREVWGRGQEGRGGAAPSHASAFDWSAGVAGGAGGQGQGGSRARGARLAMRWDRVAGVVSAAGMADVAGMAMLSRSGFGPL